MISFLCLERKEISHLHGKIEYLKPILLSADGAVNVKKNNSTTTKIPIHLLHKTKTQENIEVTKLSRYIAFSIAISIGKSESLYCESSFNYDLRDHIIFSKYTK